MTGLQPFDTARLHLRPMGAGDAALYCRLYTDAKIMRRIAAPVTPEAAQRGFDKALAQQSPRIQRWIVCERGTKKALGLLALLYDQVQDNADTDMSADASAEIGLMLLPASQGRNYALEALAAIAEQAFTTNAADRIWSRHAANHHAAARLMRLLLFERVPEAADHPAEAAEYRWQMTRERWQARHGLLLPPSM